MGYVQIFEVNKSTNNKQNFGWTDDLAKKLMESISAYNASKGLLKLYNVIRMFFFFFAAGTFSSRNFLFSNPL